MRLSSPYDYFEMSPTAIAHRKIILNTEGKPCDYLFMNVNGAYGLIHGLPKEQIIGKRLTELYPNMLTEEMGWIDRYGKLAAEPGRIEFEQSSALLDTWYRVVAVSDGSGEFISFSTDITAEKTVTQVSEVLLQNSDNLDMDIIVEQLRQLSGAKYVIYNRMDKGGDTFTTCAIAVDELTLTYAAETLGFDLIGKEWQFSRSREKEMAGTLHHFAALHHMVSNPKELPAYKSLEEKYRLGSVYVLQIMKNQILLGNFTLIMEVGKNLANHNLVEIFARQVGLALDRNQQEKALRNQSALLNGLLDSIPDTIFFKDPNSTYLGCNKRFEKYAGYPRAEIIGKTDEDIFAPELARSFREQDRLMFEKNAPHHCEEVETDDDGNSRCYDTVRAPLYDEFGTFIGLVGFSYDITTIRQTESELRESEERFRELVELSPDAIVVHVAGKFVYVNHATVTMLGATSEAELISRSIYDRLHPECHREVRERVRYFSRNHSAAVRSELRMVKMDGTLLEIESNAVPINYHGKNGTLVYIRDISSRKQAEKEKQEQLLRQRRQQKMESVGTLASGVAHEINNPITGMINYAQLILDQEEPGSETAGFAKEIISEGERIASIIRDLLDFSRQEGKGSQEIKLDELILHTLSLVKSMLQKDGISAHTDISSTLPAIQCRSQQIRQVIINLLTNAREALNEKYTGYHENKRIRIDCRQVKEEGRSWIRIMVEDNGIGILDEVVDKVFDPFFSTKPKDKNIGMGLAISYGICEEHGGRLNFDTVPGKGTRFYFDLPVENNSQL